MLVLVGCSSPPALPREVNPTVARLAQADTRDDAFRRIISWQKYRGTPAYTEEDAETIRYHVVCPQVTGPPIFAVFPDTNYEHNLAPKGHIVLVDADGTLIPFWLGANSVNGAFADINGDGIVECVDVVPSGDECVLYVLPITREQRPVLFVAFNRQSDTTPRWSWRLVASDTPGVASIQLGPVVPTTDEVPYDAWPTNINPAVTYSWSRATREYEGPSGAPNQAFWRLPSTFDWGEELNDFTQKKVMRE